MNFDTVNIFPTTLYVGKMENHEEYKKSFKKVYPKFDFPQISEHIQTINTVSENCGNPLLHLEKDLEPLFTEITIHIENYIHNILSLKDVFDVNIVKTWISRSREKNHEIPWHFHSPSQISFVYYLETPENSQVLEFLNMNEGNSIFPAIFDENCKEKDLNMVNEYTTLNSNIFYLIPSEGNVNIFPSKITHRTKSKSENFEGERLAIVGDAILILKEEYLSFSTGFIDKKFWKKFNT
jgi:hypothetical protein